MTDAAIVEKIKQALGDKLAEITNPARRRLFIKVPPRDLVQATTILRDAFTMTHVSTISGVDLGQTFEIIYHFSTPEADFNIRTEIPRDNPHVDSITPVIPGAILYEREVQEMFGIIMENIPDPRRLLLADVWPADVYPLRKDYEHPRPPEVIPGGKS
jgi:NADH-quinone oxidoreductase subunit C